MMYSKTRSSFVLTVALSLGASLALGCSNDLVQNIADGGASDASIPDTTNSVVGHMRTVGTWVFGHRYRHPFCESECFEVTKWEFTEDGQTLTAFKYLDKVPTESDTLNPDGKQDGDEYCRSVYSVRIIQDGNLDTTVRSAIELTEVSNTCVGYPWTGLPVLLDSPVALDGTLVPEVLSVHIPTSLSLVQPWPGFPDSPSDPVYALPLISCAESDHAPGRDYCLPTCDFPAAAMDRTLCGFPEWQ